MSAETAETRLPTRAATFGTAHPGAVVRHPTMTAVNEVLQRLVDRIAAPGARLEPGSVMPVRPDFGTLGVHALRRPQGRARLELHESAEGDAGFLALEIDEHDIGATLGLSYRVREQAESVPLDRIAFGDRPRALAYWEANFDLLIAALKRGLSGDLEGGSLL